jgi:hypothetical protein
VFGELYRRQHEARFNRDLPDVLAWVQGNVAPAAVRRTRHVAHQCCRRRVVLLESVLPLVSATVIAALTGITAAIPVGRTFTPPGTPTAINLPGQTYYLTMGAGLIISLTVIVLTLPLLERITVPANARFE